MASEWRTVQLQNVATLRNGAGIRQEHFAAEGTPLARVSDFCDSSIDLGECLFVDPEHAQQWESHRLKPGDVVVATVGSWPPNWSSVVGKTIRVPIEASGAIQNQNTCSIHANDNLADQRFLFYLLRSGTFAHYAANAAAGSANQARLPVARLGEFQFELPTITEQRTIARILGTLDDKIELNRKVNKTLESIARALFKSWFVDFDPVRAKAEGRPTGLPAHIDSLFPGCLEDSELGEIPNGWTVKSLGDLIELAYGKTLKEVDRKPGNIAVYGSNGQIGWHNEKLVDGPGIIVGRKGNPGVVTWAPIDFFAIDTTFYVAPKTECNSLYFLFMALKGHDLASLGADSAVPGLNRNLAYMSRQLVPPPPVLQAFDHRVRTLFYRVQKGKEESSTLAAARDSLLPKLVSGELRVREIPKRQGE